MNIRNQITKSNAQSLWVHIIIFLKFQSNLYAMQHVTCRIHCNYATSFVLEMCK